MIELEVRPQFETRHSLNINLALALAVGDRMEGMWERGKLNGFAKITYANGDRYEGDFFSGGFSSCCRGGAQRTWLNGPGSASTHARTHARPASARHRPGATPGARPHHSLCTTPHTPPPPRARARLPRRAGKFQGKGRYVYAHGRGWYEGAYYQGRQHGRGLRVFMNNNRYEGTFKFGEMEGEVRLRVQYQSLLKQISRLPSTSVDFLLSPAAPSDSYPCVDAQLTLRDTKLPPSPAFSRCAPMSTTRQSLLPTHPNHPNHPNQPNHPNLTPSPTTTTLRVSWSLTTDSSTSGSGARAACMGAACSRWCMVSKERDSVSLFSLFLYFLYFL